MNSSKSLSQVNGLKSRARTRPHVRFQLIIFLMIGIAMLAGACTNESTATVQQMESVPEAVIASPVAVQQATPTPGIPVIALEWILVGTGQLIRETLASLETPIEIPWERSEFISSTEAQERLNYPRIAVGYGDGTAYLLDDHLTDDINDESDVGGYYLTADQGNSWYRISEGPPTNERYGNRLSRIKAVFQDAGKVIMYLETDFPQTKQFPFMSAYWRAEVRPSQLESMAIAFQDLANQQAAITPIEKSSQLKTILANVPRIDLEWEEIGKGKGADEILALPIPWDRMKEYPLPVLWEQMANPPPVGDVTGPGVLFTELLGAHTIEDRVVVYVYTGEHIVGVATRSTFWKGELPISLLEGLPQQFGFTPFTVITQPVP